MIYKMNKYSFLIFHKEYESFLLRLRELGLVHIQETQDAKSASDLTELLNERKAVDMFKRQLAAKRSENAPEETRIELSEEDGKKAYLEALEIQDKLAKIVQEIANKKKEVEAQAVWGNFTPEDLDKLASAGYVLRFYACPASAYKEDWETQYGAVVINNIRSINYFVAVQHPEDQLIPDIEQIKPQMKSLNHLKLELEDMEKKKQEMTDAFISFADNRINEISAYDRALQNKFNFGSALIQADKVAEDRLMMLQGWIPEKDAASLEETLDKEGIYYEKMDIKVDDPVPIKLKNNAYSRLFEPITAMFSLPNYNEIDPTPLFAPFFMLFFALCFGDGGYGLMLLLISSLIKMKVDKKMKPFCGLFQWLGGTAAVVGALMGSVFGMVMPWAGDQLLGSVSNDYFLNQDNMMKVAIGVGLLQIVFGKFVAGTKIAKQHGFKYGLATYAWGMIIVIGGLYLLLPALAPSAPKVISYILLGILGICVLIAFFYNSPGKNPFFNFGAGIWNTYNMASGLLGDTLSYIRLFAIGLTGGILGSVFNNLAVDMSEGSIILKLTVFPLILIIGHSLNFGLAMISSLVHPLRLTFVEFYKNAEFEGGGKAYNPFKKQ